MTLQLRPYDETDESAALAIHQAMLADDFYFLLFWEPTMTWSTFLASIDELRHGNSSISNRVRSDQLVAVVDGEIVGRVSVRFELNEYLLERGGHARSGGQHVACEGQVQVHGFFALVRLAPRALRDTFGAREVA